MDIFLTGQNGFIGSHLKRALLGAGHNVYSGLEQLYLRPYDVVIHLAAVTHIGQEFDPKLFETNINFTQKVMSTPYRTLYASSCSAAHLTNPYSYTKRYAEWLGGNHHNALGFRFFNVYGPGNNKGILWYLNKQKDGADVIIRGPETIRDYIYIDDVVEYIMANIKGYIPSDQLTISTSMKKNNGIRDVGTGRPTSTIELVELYQRISGKRFNIKIEARGGNEPLEMVSSFSVPHIPLTYGIKKFIQEEAEK